MVIYRSLHHCSAGEEMLPPDQLSSSNEARGGELVAMAVVGNSNGGVTSGQKATKQQGPCEMDGSESTSG
jgi:hypothetical protein